MKMGGLSRHAVLLAAVLAGLVGARVAEARREPPPAVKIGRAHV